MKRTTTTATIELRDDCNRLVKILKRKVSIARAYEYLAKHGDVIWHKNMPCAVVINWN